MAYGEQGRRIAAQRLVDELKARSTSETVPPGAIALAYIGIGDTANAIASLQEVYATIDELEPSPAEVEEHTRHEELFRNFLVPGTLLLGLQILLSATWLRRFP